jgi:hypothetical protein
MAMEFQIIGNGTPTIMVKLTFGPTTGMVMGNPINGPGIIMGMESEMLGHST